MDPNANLEEQRRIAARILADDLSRIADTDRELERDRDTERLAELVEALDGWLSKGGFLPNDWQNPKGGR